MTDEYQIDSTTFAEKDANGLILILSDSSTDPSNNGEIRRNGVDVKVYSGGSVQNLSNLNGVTQAEYVTLSTDSTLANERTLNAGDDLTLTDNGAGNDVTLDVTTPSDAQYVTLATDADLSQERTLNAVNSLTQTDNGANDSIDLDVADNGITGLEIDLADIAGTNLTVDTANDELDASQTQTLQDSGSDNADGGDIYNLPQVEDSVDLQSGGEISNAEDISANAISLLNGGSISDPGAAADNTTASQVSTTHDSSDHTTGIESQPSPSVGTSATTIHDGDRGMAVVYGQQTNNAGNIFFDVVSWVGQNHTVMASNGANANARTYNATGSVLELTMGGNTYAVTTMLLTADAA